MSDKQTASDEFEAIARKKALEQESDKAENLLDVFRFEFASKIAQGQDVSVEDILGYLSKWADYNIAFRTSEAKPMRDFRKLKDDCDNGRLSKLVETHLKDRVRWAKEMIPSAERAGLRLTQDAMFGVEPADTPIGKAIHNTLLESANETAWLPYELKGLESGLALVKNK